MESTVNTADPGWTDESEDEDWNGGSDGSSLSIGPQCPSTEDSAPYESPTMIGFSYYPSPALSSDSQQIRLLRIEDAAHPEEPLRLSLTVHSLRETPQYPALSYAWGASTLSQLCIVNNIPLPLTNNLAAALMRLRQSVEMEYLWIDAICIDQANVAERGHQVGLMMEIYGKASTVLVWLGYSHEKRVRYSTLNSQSIRSDPGDLAANHKQRSLLYALEHTSPRWWERVWTVQEVVVAQSDPVFGFGPYRVGWKELESLLDTAIGHIFPDYPSLRRLDGVLEYPILQRSDINEERPAARLSYWLRLLNVLKQRYRAGETTLREAFDITSLSSATDLRDKVCALRGLLAGEMQTAIKPNYTASYSDVFRDALLACAIEERSFRLLAGCCASDADDDSLEANHCTGGLVTELLPSWIMKMCRKLDIKTDSFVSSAVKIINDKDFVRNYYFNEYDYTERSERGFPRWIPSIRPSESKVGTFCLHCHGTFIGTVRAVSLVTSSQHLYEMDSDTPQIDPTVATGAILIKAVARSLQKTSSSRTYHPQSRHLTQERRSTKRIRIWQAKRKPDHDLDHEAAQFDNLQYADMYDLKDGDGFDDIKDFARFKSDRLSVLWNAF